MERHVSNAIVGLVHERRKQVESIATLATGTADNEILRFPIHDSLLSFRGLHLISDAERAHATDPASRVARFRVFDPSGL
jgi:hypothetical protein